MKLVENTDPLPIRARCTDCGTVWDLDEEDIQLRLIAGDCVFFFGCCRCGREVTLSDSIIPDSLARSLQEHYFTVHRISLR